MSHTKSVEVALSVKLTDELIKNLDDLRQTWKHDAHAVPRGLQCSESKEGRFTLVAAESAFVTLPGACVIKGLGAIELVGSSPAFAEGIHSRDLIIRAGPDGWKFSVKFVPPIIRDRHQK